MPSPTSYDELYYEIIRVHQIFDNLYSMGECDNQFCCSFDKTLLARSMPAFKEDNCSTFDGENSILMTHVYRDSSDVSDWLILARENSNHSSNQSEIAHGFLLSYVTRMEFFVSSLTHLRGGKKLSV